MLIRITNGVPETYTIGQLRRDNLNVSFPKDIPAKTLEAFGVYEVKELPRPPFDPETHYLKASDFYQVEGKWQVHYYPEPLPLAQVKETMQARRTNLLAQSDWIVVVAYERQESVPQEWVAYRQALRDVPAQQDFPYEILWPNKPA